MKKTFLLSTALVLASTASFDANAEERWPRWYVGLSGGLSIQPDEGYNQVAGGVASGDFKFDEGYTVSASLGYKLPFEDAFFGNSNIELEVGYNEEGLESSSGESQVTTYAINYIYDVPSDGSVSPYLGAGIGLADIELTTVNPLGVDLDDDFAFYQLMVGLGYDPETIPRTTWTIGYRYQSAISDIELQNGGTKVDYDYENHAVEAGVRYKF